jgi:hypothetical protein
MRLRNEQASLLGKPSLRCQRAAVDVRNPSVDVLLWGSWNPFRDAGLRAAFEYWRFQAEMSTRSNLNKLRLTAERRNRAERIFLYGHEDRINSYESP